MSAGCARGTVLAALAALALPWAAQLRNTAHKVALAPLQHELVRNRGFVSVQHSEETVQRVSLALPEPISAPRLHMYFQSTCTRDDAAAAQAAGKGHTLLIHGTGANADTWFDTGRSSAPLKHARGFNVSIVERFQGRFPGMCVTAIDLRGHGRSDVTPGPYSVELLAADVAATLEGAFGPHLKVHVVGHSLGFGTTISLALNYPGIVQSISGSGFLADRTNADFAAWLFSRRPVVHALGTHLLGLACELAIQCLPSGYMRSQFAKMDIEGFALASASWLKFNERKKLRSLKAPALYIFPKKDSLAGYALESFELEVSMIPRAKLVTFLDSDQFDHCMPYFDARAFFAPVFDWIAEHNR